MKTIKRSVVDLTQNDLNMVTGGIAVNFANIQGSFHSTVDSAKHTLNSMDFTPIKNSVLSAIGSVHNAASSAQDTIKQIPIYYWIDAVAVVIGVMGGVYGIKQSSKIRDYVCFLAGCSMQVLK